ncbi:MAG: transposase [Promethearchaeota archaeon CR_4]|nr:MAG: transposase [Candidatus Lokiarchaeota archaeon CR_4]
MLMATKTYKVVVPHTKYRYGAGLDVHKDYITACVAVQRGAEVEKITVQEFKQSPPGLGDLRQFLRKYLLEIVVMEATGVYTPPVKRTLDDYRGWGMIKPAITVINPSLLRKYPGEPHDDKRDALDLTALGLRGMARGSFIPAGEAREL